MIRKKKKVQDPLVISSMPRSFVKAVDIQKTIKGYPTRSDFLRELAKDLTPSIKELKKKGLIKEDEEFFQ